MIKTKDKRHFFTHEKYFPQLIEFSKTFGAEISVVKVKEDNILDLDELAPAICNGNYRNDTEYELISQKIAQFSSIKTEKPTTKRRKILKLAAEVKKYIEDKFESRKIVSFKDVSKKFSNLDKATISNHIARVKKQLISQGCEIQTLKKGSYVVNYPRP